MNMCLGVTARVVKIDGQKADVEFDGVTQTISIAMTPEVKIGEYVLLHAGFAISIIDQNDGRGKTPWTRLSLPNC
jgi:hydrogenase expression/formation protein HypC